MTAVNEMTTVVMINEWHGGKALYYRGGRSTRGDNAQWFLRVWQRDWPRKDREFWQWGVEGVSADNFALGMDCCSLSKDFAHTVDEARSQVETECRRLDLLRTVVIDNGYED